VLLVERDHPVVEEISGGQRRLSVVKLGEADLGVGVDEGLLVDASDAALSGILCARLISSLSDEPFAEDDGELGLGLEPLPRRPLPFLRRVVENEI
jgi:hypothetical protein